MDRQYTCVQAIGPVVDHAIMFLNAIGQVLRVEWPNGPGEAAEIHAEVSADVGDHSVIKISVDYPSGSMLMVLESVDG